MEQYMVTMDYKVIGNTERETKILENEIHTFEDMAKNYMRELTIKKYRAIILTWLHALDVKELLNVYDWIKGVMKERNIDAK